MLSAEGLGCPALIDNETDTVVENVSIVDAVQQMVDRSFERAAQLDKYTAEQLNSAPRWVARVKAGVTEAQLEAATGLGFDAYAGGNGDIFLLDVGTMSSQEIIDNLASQSIIKQFYPDLPVEYSKYSIPNDPLFGDQWYLRNVGQLVSQPDTLNTYATWGEDIRALEAWETATGKGVVIAIVDDGLLLSHPDLGAYGTPDWDPTKANPFIGYDIAASDILPFPDVNNGDFHGTAVAGIAAGTGNNGIGITGVAYDATLAGIRFLSTPVKQTDSALGFMLFLNPNDIDIYNNSWGPGVVRQLAAPGPLTAQALLDAALKGRVAADGTTRLGNIHVFAAGNDGEEMDSANFNGLANSIYVITVGAVNHNGVATAYNETGANIHVVAPSGDGPSGLTTTDIIGDLGYNQIGIDNDQIGRDYLEDVDYTSRFNGTSAAAPVVSGVVALMLEAAANNGIELSFRDVKQILALSARKNDPLDPGWFAGGGYFINPITEVVLPDGTRRPIEPRDTSEWVNDGNLVLPPGNGQGPGDPIPGVSPAPDVTPSWLNPFTFAGLQGPDGLNAPPARWVNGAGLTVHYSHATAYGHGVVDAALAVKLAANWNSWVARGTQVEWYHSATGSVFPGPAGDIPAAEVVFGQVIPGGIGGSDGFAEFFAEFFNPDPPPPPDGPFNDLADLPQNSRGSTVPFYGPQDMDIESITLSIDIDVDPDEVDHLRIAIMSPDGTISEFNNNLQGVGNLPGFIPEAEGDNLTWTFSTIRHMGEKGARETVDVNPNSFTYGQVITKPWQLIVENFSTQSEAHINSFSVDFYGKRVAPGRIQGFVGLDVDNSGDVVFPDDPMYDPTQVVDQVLSGVTVWLDVNNDGVQDPNEPWQITGADGNYYFDIPFNTAQRPHWQVGIQIPEGYEDLLQPGVSDVMLSGPVVVGRNLDPLVPDDQQTGVSFQLAATAATLSGTAFADMDGDGTSDGDPRLGGRVIYIDLNENGEFDDPDDPFEPTPDTLFTVTNPDGTWSISANLTPGYYTIAIAPEAGMVPSSPASGFYRIFVSPGDVITGLDFGTNPNEGLVTGYVFLDANGDGIQDPGESRINGFSVFVDIDNDGKVDFNEPVVRSTADGGFAFNDLPFNQYAIRLLHQPGWVITTTEVHNIEIAPGSSVGGLAFGVKNTASHDFGDLPMSYGSASHGLFPGMHLGATVDGEVGSAYSPDAKGDDMQGMPDEDGVLNASSVLIEANQTFILTIEASPESLGLLYLQGWIDYNNDGNFDDPGEHLQFLDPNTGQPIAGNGNGRQIRLTSPISQLMVRAPGNIAASELAARFRYGEAAANGVSRFNKPTGAANIGEVEDYFLSAQQTNVTHVPQLAGDYDGNNVVDVGDYELWKSTFGSTTQLAADGNGDGVVDKRDFVLWRNNLGNVAGAGLAAVVATEEPIVDAFAGAPNDPALVAMLAARGAVAQSGLVDGEMATWFTLPVAGEGAALGAGLADNGFFVMPQADGASSAHVDPAFGNTAVSTPDNSALDLAFLVEEEDREEASFASFAWGDDQEAEEEALALALEEVFG